MSGFRSLVPVGLALTICVGVAAAAVPANPIDPQQAVEGNHVGAHVQWGGEILARRSGNQGATCLDIASLPLDENNRPFPLGIAGRQRFLACLAKPSTATYAPNSLVTVSGTLDKTVTLTEKQGCAISGYEGTAHHVSAQGCDFYLPQVNVDKIQVWNASQLGG